VSDNSYRDMKSRIIFVSDGISDGRHWGTFHRKPSGALARIKSKFLPMRDIREDAQADLDRYAIARKYPIIKSPD